MMMVLIVVKTELKRLISLITMTEKLFLLLFLAFASSQKILGVITENGL